VYCGKVSLSSVVHPGVDPSELRARNGPPGSLFCPPTMRATDENLELRRRILLSGVQLVFFFWFFVPISRVPICLAACFQFLLCCASSRFFSLLCCALDCVCSVMFVGGSWFLAMFFATVAFQGCHAGWMSLVWTPLAWRIFFFALGDF
jgi:hypothetical protein